MLRQGSGSLMGTGTGKQCGGSGSSLGRDAVGKKKTKFSRNLAGSCLGHTALFVTSTNPCRQLGNQ